jgi:large subunit ribosomal protein L23
MQRPSHVITFLRKKNQPPNEATFNVPLRFTKFDLRDYLWNLYNVEVKKVRSYVQQQPLARRNNFSNSYYRPQSKKFMIVDLVKPFQWPEVPENKDPWYNDLWEQRREALQEQSRQQQNQARGKLTLKSAQTPSTERSELAALAKQVLAGEVKWSNDLVLDPKWDAIVKKTEAKAGTEVAAQQTDKE